MRLAIIWYTLSKGIAVMCITCAIFYRALVITTAFALPNTSYSRSPFRTERAPLPTIVTSWADGLKSSDVRKRKMEKESYLLCDSHIEPYPIFTMQSDLLDEYRLPSGPIRHHYNSEQSSLGNTISELIAEVLNEVRTKRKPQFSHFKILQGKNFNYKRRCGLIILQFNDHPFVLKLFIGNPCQSLLQRHSLPAFFSWVAAQIATQLA